MVEDRPFAAPPRPLGGLQELPALKARYGWYQRPSTGEREAVIVPWGIFNNGGDNA